MITLNVIWVFVLFIIMLAIIYVLRDFLLMAGLITIYFIVLGIGFIFILISKIEEFFNKLYKRK